MVFLKFKDGGAGSK